MMAATSIDKCSAIDATRSANQAQTVLILPKSTNMAKLLVRLALGLLATTALLAMTGPLALYWIGLEAVKTMPSPPATMATAEQQAAIWSGVRGQGDPFIPKLNPYSFLPYVASTAPQDPGVLISWQVASTHLLEHRRYRGMFWWHLSGAALTIWITRNWSSEQILSAASRFKARGSASR
ncbi:hypothetical protein G8A07_27080 [Roseateles sp. DAIF2]|uniref:hypothetical protein n=1 Tax=Roseateles sp. DAIF2 TaxID=2714952 RepID=UPI0018A2C0BC|nr:hypothetical protein [Roseateles sp. DAIF2]QPF76230.1 hypothetical protein G8A07_27080 [Roseateles sp. DAIF2]